MLNYSAIELPMGGWKASGPRHRHGAGGIRKYCAQQALLVSRLQHEARPAHVPLHARRTPTRLLKAFRLLWGRGKRD